VASFILYKNMADKEIQPFTNIAIAEQGIENQGTTFLSNLRSLSIGDGGSNVFRADKDGMFLGGETFDTAVFKVTMAGAVTATSITITGGTMKYGKTSFTDSVHDGYYISSSGLYFGSASDATKLKYIIATGALDITGSITGSTITGGTLQTSASIDVDRVKISGANNQIEFWNVENDLIATITPYSNVVNYMGGVSVDAGGGTYLSLSGKGNMGFSTLGASGDDDNSGGITITWDANDPTTLRISLLSLIGGASVDLPFDANILPYATASYDLGASGKVWANLYVNSITLNGTTRTSWPTSGITSLSELSINTAKSWGGYGITGLGSLTATSNNSYDLGSSSYYWRTAYLTKIEFLSLSTDPSSRTYGQMWHHYEGGGGAKNFRGTPWNEDVYTFDMTAV